MSLLIREAHTQDSTTASAVVKAVYDEYGFTWEADGYHSDLADLDGVYWAAGGAFFVAELEGRVVGTAGFERFPFIPGTPACVALVGGIPRAAATDCSLARLYLLPVTRGLGIGRALFEHVIEVSRQVGCSAMEIWSDKRFLQAQNLYQKAGAVLVGERICPGDPDESSEWGYRLSLE